MTRSTRCQECGIVVDREVAWSNGDRCPRCASMLVVSTRAVDERLDVEYEARDNLMRRSNGSTGSS